MNTTTLLSSGQDPRNLRCPNCTERLGDVSDCDEQMVVVCDACDQEVTVSKTLGERWLATCTAPSTH
jgi:DNA-directed RNA polymerase subunit RPC12/RpoP